MGNQYQYRPTCLIVIMVSVVVVGIAVVAFLVSSLR